MPRFVYKGRQDRIRAGGIVWEIHVPQDVESPTAEQLASFSAHNVHEVVEKPKPEAEPVASESSSTPPIYRPKRRRLTRKD